MPLGWLQNQRRNSFTLAGTVRTLFYNSAFRWKRKNNMMKLLQLMARVALALSRAADTIEQMGYRMEEVETKGLKIKRMWKTKVLWNKVMERNEVEDSQKELMLRHVVKAWRKSKLIAKLKADTAYANKNICSNMILSCFNFKWSVKCCCTLSSQPNQLRVQE